MTEKQGFWTSLPGILTGLAAVITAMTGLYVAIFNFTPDETKPIPEPIPEPIPGPIPDPIPGPTPDPTPDPVPAIGKANVLLPLTEQDFYPFPKTGLLVNCDHFPSVNSVGSLMSWSNHYYKAITDGSESPKYACNQTIGYRGRAHCMEPENSEIRQDLLESLALCKKLGFEWHQVEME